MFSFFTQKINYLNIPYYDLIDKTDCVFYTIVIF